MSTSSQAANPTSVATAKPLRSAVGQDFSAGERGNAGQSLRQIGDRGRGLRIQPRQHLEQSRQPLADQGQIRSGMQIGGRGIGDVGARGDDPGAGAARGADHVAGGTAHGSQAHFAQKIVIILVEQHDLGLFGLQQTIVLVHAVGQHRIEKTYPVPGLAQQGDHLQGRERRIGFGTQYLLLVEAQVIRVANQD